MTSPSRGGLPLLLPALAFGVLSIAGVALSAGMPRPGAQPAAILAYQQAHVTSGQVAGFLQVAAAIPLAILAAAAYQRLQGLGIRAPGPAIGLAGGLLAASATTVLGVVGWATAHAAPASDAAVANALAALAFALGSAGYVPMLSLLVAGVAVPALLTGLLPRWLGIAGLVIAAVGMLSTFTMLTSALYPTLPVGRFGGLLWLVAAAATLPAHRPRRVAV
ncbi:MAG TPA: DUF4386 domain-containing protein [Actinophytocola sp.]|jgi:hypothetical protein|nr:DUF4386 domain-containing protein [Actinophytocola sp.]